MESKQKNNKGQQQQTEGGYFFCLDMFHLLQILVA